MQQHFQVSCGAAAAAAALQIGCVSANGLLAVVALLLTIRPPD
jgi:hypothetical protein